MFTEEEKNRLSVGLKQTTKSILAGADKVFVAGDTPYDIIEKIKAVYGGELVEVESMKELGRMCGIDVKASCAALRK